MHETTRDPGIHPTAVIDDGAQLGQGVTVGAYAVIGPGVTIGDGSVVEHHADVRGPAHIGAECVLGFSSAIGHDPQIKGGDGRWGSTHIGDRNVFREFSQVHRSRTADGETRVGNDGYFMSGSHIGHDCQVGDHVTLCSGALLAGHVEVADRAFFGGQAAIHQFCRVGTLAMVAGHAGLSQDCPPFGTVVGCHPARLTGPNAVGIRRAGLSTEARLAIRVAYRTLFRGDGTLEERLARVDTSTPEVAHLVEFVRTAERGVVGIARRET